MRVALANVTSVRLHWHAVADWRADVVLISALSPPSKMVPKHLFLNPHPKNVGEGGGGGLIQKPT